MCGYRLRIVFNGRRGIQNPRLLSGQEAGVFVRFGGGILSVPFFIE